MTGTWYKCPDCDKQVDCSNGVPVDCPHCANDKKRPAIVMTAKRIPESNTTRAFTLDEYMDATSGKGSGEEYTRYCLLYRFQQAGIISHLELQPLYEVQPRIVIKSKRDWYKGFTQSRQTYSPDFRYRYDGITIVEEYKGAQYRRKLKGDQKIYPRITEASRKNIKLLMTNNRDFVNGNALFVITGYYKAHKRYYAFNANSKMFKYPLANEVTALEWLRQSERVKYRNRKRGDAA